MLHWRFLNVKVRQMLMLAWVNCAMKTDLHRTSFRRKYFMVFPTGSLYMEVCRLLKIMVLQLWVSVKILALWAQFLSMWHMLVRILAMMIQKRVSHIAFSIQNDLTTQTLACAWLAIVTPPRATIPSMSGHRGATALKTFGKQVTDVVAWRER